MELITSVTVGSGGAASVTLPATGTIPQTYTDLQIVMSVRGSRSEVVSNTAISFNGSTANFTNKYLEGNGTSASSGSLARFVGAQPAATATANTFSNNIIYIPNYTSSNFKSFSCDSVTENNATLAYATLFAGLWSDTSAITTITLSSSSSDNFVEGSTFYLYGISNVTSGSKATGGIVSSDGTYWYHMFPYSGTFTPTSAISADILCVAGGGGGGAWNGGGGGAGGLLTFTSQSLTATGYTVTVGSGGAGGVTSTAGTTGNDSQFGSLTLVKGGGGGGGDASVNGKTGGSGGGASFAGTAGSATSGQGYAGGAGDNAGPVYGAGGGGAGGAGTAGTSNGKGGVGLSSSLTDAMGLATSTGDPSGSNYYYAGGGTGGNQDGTTIVTGTLGGGGSGGTGYNATVINPTAGKINTGGGGGGATAANSGAAGGSGVVIIRYAI